MSAVIRFPLEEVLADIAKVVACIEKCLEALTYDNAKNTGFDASGTPTFELYNECANANYNSLVKAIRLLGDIWFYQVSTSKKLHIQMVQKMVFDEVGGNTDYIRLDFKLLSDPSEAYLASC